MACNQVIILPCSREQSQNFPQIDVEWAKKHIRGYAKWKAAIDAMRADELRYRLNPGYQPGGEMSP